MVCHVNETDREASIPPSLEEVIMRKLTHLVKERDVLGPVMSFMTYFCTTGLECYLALPRVFMKLRQGTPYQSRKIPIRYHSP